ncbi:methyltransferase, partial [Agrococcus sp. HG114]|uniref:methyltransferase n=1 Tax=Agrococcus sp. HG114 TaxID=2969757 RepID=UPI00215B3249
MTDRDALFAALRRWPDVEDPTLQAHDASDALILDEAGALDRLDDVVVIGDRHGALALGALAAGAARVRVHQDSIVGERALDANAERTGLSAFAHHGLDASLVAGARLVLLQLPRSLDALDEIAELVATYADDAVRVVAGGRVKHMSMSMNALLGRSFQYVRASHGRRKSRVLHAEGPLRPGISWPRSRTHRLAGGPLTVVAHGAAFAGTAIDIGAQTLLEHLGAMPDASHAIDLACGTGVLGVALAQARPHV